MVKSFKKGDLVTDRFYKAKNIGFIIRAIDLGNASRSRYKIKWLRWMPQREAFVGPDWFWAADLKKLEKEEDETQ